MYKFLSFSSCVYVCMCMIYAHVEVSTQYQVLLLSFLLVWIRISWCFDAKLPGPRVCRVLHLHHLPTLSRRTGDADMQYRIWLMSVLGIQTQILMAANQVLYPLSQPQGWEFQPSLFTVQKGSKSVFTFVIRYHLEVIIYGKFTISRMPSWNYPWNRLFCKKRK